MTLGERLRQLRDDKGLKQREVGAIIEVDGAFISKVENNDKRLNRRHIKQLSKFFEVPEEELQILWLADKIHSFILEEKLGLEAMNKVIERMSK